MKHVILKCLVGSNAYGTNIEGSDRDYKGIFVQDPEDVLEVGYQEQYSIGKDETYYEIRRFADLAAKGNPTMLELLFTPEDCIIYKHPVMDQLLNIRYEFLSKSCRHSFVGYAHEQVQKAGGLEKKMNWEKDLIVRRPNAQFLVDIRKGKYDLKTILVEAEKDIKTLNEAYDKSDLPDHADRGKIMKTITKMRKDLYQSLKDAKTNSTVGGVS